MDSFGEVEMESSTSGSLPMPEAGEGISEAGSIDEVSELCESLRDIVGCRELLW